MQRAPDDLPERYFLQVIAVDFSCITALFQFYDTKLDD